MDDLCMQTATDLAAAIRDGAVSAREVVSSHLDRIERVNPAVNAIVTLDAEGALAAAEEADRRMVAGEPVGALHGLPVAHKDTHETAGLRTTFGSRLYAENVPRQDDLVVARMRAAGAITVGKTNVPEFGAGSHTFNAVFGVTRNPYDLTRSAGGSSGGAAAALAARLQPLADGSDMGGSLRNPAAFCNVVGFRPSPGRAPTVASPMGWTTLTTQGPMARTVEDVALLLSVLAGPDPRCPFSLDEPGSVFAGSLERDVSGLRVAWSPDLGGQVPVEAAVRDVVASQAAVFERLGCLVREACPSFAGAEEAFRALRAWEFAANLAESVDRHPDLFKASLVWNVDEGRRLTGADLARAEQQRTSLYRRVVRFFEAIDVLVLPTTQVVPFEADQEYPTIVDGQPQHTYLDWMRSAYFVSVTGCPAISVPAGFTPDGLPVGLQIVGPPRADLRVLQVAHAYEQATQHWRQLPPL